MVIGRRLCVFVGDSLVKVRLGFLRFFGVYIKGVVFIRPRK